MNKKEFAVRLARLRVKKGVSARKMSSFIGQNPGYINSIEAGKTMPSFEVFWSICEFLEVTPSEFFDMESSDPSKVNAIVQDMKKLNEQQLETISALVKGLAKK